MWRKTRLPGAPSQPPESCTDNPPLASLFFTVFPQAQRRGRPGPGRAPPYQCFLSWPYITLSCTSRPSLSTGLSGMLRSTLFGPCTPSTSPQLLLPSFLDHLFLASLLTILYLLLSHRLHSCFDPPVPPLRWLRHRTSEAPESLFPGFRLVSLTAWRIATISGLITQQCKAPRPTWSLPAHSDSRRPHAAWAVATSARCTFPRPRLGPVCRSHPSTPGQFSLVPQDSALTTVILLRKAILNSALSDNALALPLHETYDPKGRDLVSSEAPQAQSHYSKMWKSIMSLQKKANPVFACSQM